MFDAPADGGEGFRSDPFTFHAWDVRKPVIAAINGHAVGIGLTMALQCDLRYVLADAKLGIVQNRRGINPDLRSHWTLPRLVGHGRATELLLTGRMFSGTDAAAWGIALEALPSAAAVLDRAIAVAQDIATNTAPRSVAASKALLWRSPAPSVGRGGRLGAGRAPRPDGQPGHHRGRHGLDGEAGPAVAGRPGRRLASRPRGLAGRLHGRGDGLPLVEGLVLSAWSWRRSSR